MKYHITKSFGEYPFAHRQPSHSGHCAHIHGHNWSFILCLQADHLDSNGFVFDFGKFGPVKEWLKQNFDHTTVLEESDPVIAQLVPLQQSGMIRMIIAPSASCEGIAAMFYEYVQSFLEAQGVAARVSIHHVTVTEDLKNSATFNGNSYE